ncbi:MAG: snoRNA-binding rRNA-processing protein utp10 [Trizodia sp. TS-e1964]|nr:MAG: snoRNA-binding rRNA-processing protein utp10 [Trizodia sp. TS-e1964]
MATALRAQLAKIAANSSNALNLKAQKAAHSQSLIFEPQVAASQTFDTLYAICIEGFQELCQLDKRYAEFSRSIFSEQSKIQERNQLTPALASELNRVLEDFLGLVASRILLKPALKALEWLIRRFKVHQENTSFLLLTFLPYHGCPIFRTLLSILPPDIPRAFKFLHPYIKSLANPPLEAIVKATVGNKALATALNSHVLKMSESLLHHSALLSFWASVMTQALSGMLDLTRSGRQALRTQGEEDVLLKILPTLNEGLTIEKVPELKIGCYMLLIVLASKVSLGNKVLSGMIETVTIRWTAETLDPALKCIAILVQGEEKVVLSPRVIHNFLKVENLIQKLSALSQQCMVSSLMYALLENITNKPQYFRDPKGINLVLQVLESSILDQSQTYNSIKGILLASLSFEVVAEDSVVSRDQLSDMLVRIASADEFSDITRQVINDTGIDVDHLEARLQTLILPAEEPNLMEIEPADLTNIAVQETWDDALENLSDTLEGVPNLLSAPKSDAFNGLLHAFLLAVQSPEHLGLFDQHPALRQERVLEEPFYLSFYIRVWSGNYPILARASALMLTSKFLRSLENCQSDFQVLLPYLSIALSDTSPKVRHAAAELLATLFGIFKSQRNMQNLVHWGANFLCTVPDSAKPVELLPTEDIAKIIGAVFIPCIEECKLDESHITKAITSSLTGKSMEEKATETKKLRSSLRLAFMTFLCSHIASSKLYVVKFKLLKIINKVDRVGTVSRTKLLLPIVEHWASLSQAEANNVLSAEHVNLEDFEEQVMAIAASNDPQGLQLLHSIISSQGHPKRPTLTKAALKRISNLWPRLKTEPRLSTANFLLDFSLIPGLDSDMQDSQGEALEVLRGAKLKSEILLSFLEGLPNLLESVESSPAAKKRKTGHNEMVPLNLQNGEFSSSIRRVTLVLDLLDSSELEVSFELLGSLFRLLGSLQHLREKIDSEMAYLQSIILGNMLAIIKAFQESNKQKFEPSAVRADILIECLRSTTSPQVQNTALLLVASIAKLAPDLILHNIMPVFTFMGSAVLSHDDEYSIHVIDQTISQTIPPLLKSLRKQNRSIVLSVAELLLSFVAAYEHVPSYRRLRLFTKLIEILGPEDFLFAVIAMLVHKFPSDPAVEDFVVQLSVSFGIRIQLFTASKYLILIEDALKPVHEISQQLLHLNQDDQPQGESAALQLLLVLPKLLASSPSTSQTIIPPEVDVLTAEIRALHSKILEVVLCAVDVAKDRPHLREAWSNSLQALLSLLSISEFISSVQDLLKSSSNIQVHRKLLRALELRIRQSNQVDSPSRNLILEFLSALPTVIENSEDILLIHAAISCADQISEKFGKKDPDAVLIVASTISGKKGLGSEDDSLSILSILALASMTEVLGEGIIPVLPQSIKQAFEKLEASLQCLETNQKLHDGVFSFVETLLVHIPWIISGPYLDSLLNILTLCVRVDFDAESNETRNHVFQILAEKVAAKECFSALERNWDLASEAGSTALKDFLNILDLALETHPKSAISRNTGTLKNIFFKAFDLRRVAGSDLYDLDQDIPEIESLTADAAIKMIYKLNDATFRPLFVDIVNWASKGISKKATTERISRLISLFNFLAVFFSSLKSIVTNYAKDILPIAVENITPSTPAPLISAILTTLSTAFEHDQDEFWQTPTHFTAIQAPLLALLSSTPSPLLISSLAALGVAADSSTHHKTLNTALLGLMRAHSGATRLAAVQTQHALTHRLGEEWLGMLPEMLPGIAEVLEDEDEAVEEAARAWVVEVEAILGEKLSGLL